MAIEFGQKVLVDKIGHGVVMPVGTELRKTEGVVREYAEQAVVESQACVSSSTSS